MSPPITTPTDARPRITDSPWFWVYLFSTGAFAALMLMQTKYQNRQGHLERVYRYGTRTLERQPGATLSDNTPHGTKADDSDPFAGAPLAAAPQPSTQVSSQEPMPEPTQEPLIPLKPLRVIIGLAMVVSFIAVQWSYLRRRTKALP